MATLSIALWLAGSEVVWCGGYFLDGGTSEGALEHCRASLAMWKAAQPPDDSCRDLAIPLLTTNEDGVLVTLNCECWDDEDSVWYAACEKPVQSVQEDGVLQTI